MSENAIDSENTSRPAPDTAKPKGVRKPANKAGLHQEVEVLYVCRHYKKETNPDQLPLNASGIRLIDPIANGCYFFRIETEAMWFSHSSWSLAALPLAVIVYFSFSIGTGGFSIFMSTRPRSMLGS